MSVITKYRCAKSALDVLPESAQIFKSKVIIMSSLTYITDFHQNSLFPIIADYGITHTCESSSGSIFLPILRVPPVNFQNLPPVEKIKYQKILTYILRSIFLEIPHLEFTR